MINLIKFSELPSASLQYANDYITIVRDNGDSTFTNYRVKSVDVFGTASYSLFSDYSRASDSSVYSTISNSASYSDKSTSGSYSNYSTSGSYSVSGSYSDYSTSASYGVSASYSNESNHALIATTASYIDGVSNLSSSYAVSSSYASTLAIGTTVYLTSGSNDFPPSYIEQYDIDYYRKLPNVPQRESRMFYDSAHRAWSYWTDKGFAILPGKEVIWAASNGDTWTIPKGTVVYLSGSAYGGDTESGSIGTFVPAANVAIADGTGLRYNAVGVTRCDIFSGSFGYVLQSGVAHNLDTSGFSVGDTLWLSTTTPGAVTNVKPGQPYEVVQIGFVQIANTAINGGSIIVDIVAEPLTSYAYAGITTPVSILNNQNGTVTVSTGSVNLFSNPDGIGAVSNYSLPETPLTLITGSTNYILAQRSGSSNIGEYFITTTKIVNGLSIIPISQIDVNYVNSGSWELHQLNLNVSALALANRAANKDTILNGYQRQAGNQLFLTGSGTDFGLTEGSTWYGPTIHQQQSFHSLMTGSNETHHWASSASVWTEIKAVGYDNENYNAVDGLAALAPLSWSANFVYRIITDPDSVDASIVLSNAQYPTEIDADSSQPPSDLPYQINDFGLLVGRFIIQSGSTTPTIQSAYTNTFAAASVTRHENLLGLQGGQGGEYFHLTNADYLGTGTGLVVRSSKPTFYGATPGHIPYWNNSQQLTLTGSVQVYQDAYVLINSGSPDFINPEALLVAQKNSSSVNVIAGYGNVDNYLQVNISNKTGSVNASSDFVATNDIGDVNSHYIDVGINSSGYNNIDYDIGGANDGYVYVNSGNLSIGTQTTGDIIKFHTGGTTIDKVRAYIDDTGLYATGSLIGTASYSISSSYALTASYVSGSGGGSSVSSSYATTASHAINAVPMSFGMIIDGNGSVPTTGSKGYVTIPYNMTITGWNIFGNATGSAVVDIRKSSFANFGTMISIDGNESPTLIGQFKNQDLALTAWTGSISTGDIIEFYLNSVSIITRLSVSIFGNKN